MSANRVEVGPHLAEYEPDTGFLKMTQVGVIEADHAEGIMAAFGQLGHGDQTASFVLADNTRATGISAEARRVFGKGRPEGVTPAKTFIAIYGSSFTFRTVANLVMTALRMMGHDLDGTSERSEAEARAWLEAKKRTHEATK